MSIKVKPVPVVGNDRAGGSRPARQSLSALSSTLSASSSLSGSEPTSGESPSLSAGRFKNYHKPTVTDSPHLVFLCQKYIDELDLDGLAKIARTRGLPPHLRQYAWPLLLSSHPYAKEPSIIAEFPSEPIGKEQVPYKRIRGDILRYRKRFGKTGPPTVTKMSGSTSSAYTRSVSASSTPTEENNSSSSSILDESKVTQYLTESLEGRSCELIEEAVIKFLAKWGKTVQYEPALTYAAFALADWLHPVYEMETVASSESTGSSQASSPELFPMSMRDSDNRFLFADTFERLILVLLRSPATGTDGPSGPSDSPTAERITRFLSVFQKLLPDVWAHFLEEDVVSSIGGDEWLVWWIKWQGVKVWNKYDRARIWDMYFGWRPNSRKSSDKPSVIDEVDVGLDPFWNPMELESTQVLDPHTQHTFICLALLKTKRDTLLELDQNEIRQYLSRVSRCKDIESVVTEAGECWRSWEYVEEQSEMA